jgi:asparagine synthase (glutamine-hydrolysing)
MKNLQIRFAFEAWTSSGAADAGFLEPKEVERLFEDHRRGRANHGRTLYALAMFSCWWNDQKEQRRAARFELPERRAAHA